MYTKEQTLEMLTYAAIYIDGTSSYRILHVDTIDKIVYLECEVDGDQVSMDVDEVDLNDPEVSLYTLTLMNPLPAE